jgi:hypothetical protein
VLAIRFHRGTVGTEDLIQVQPLVHLAGCGKAPVASGQQQRGNVVERFVLRQRVAQGGHGALALADTNRVQRRTLFQRFWVRSRGMAAYSDEDRRINLFDFTGELQSGGHIQDVQA